MPEISSIRKMMVSENERSANRIVAIVSIQFALMCLLNMLTLCLDYSDGLSIANRYVVMPIGILLVILDFIAWRQNFDAPWIKWGLLGGITLMCMAEFFIFTTYAAYFVVLPIFISTRYYNKKLIRYAATATVALFLISVYLNIVLEPISPLVQLFHENASYNSWLRVIDALMYIILPMLLVVIFISGYGVHVTDHGSHMLRREIEYTARVSSVNAELKMAADIQRSALPPENYATADGHLCLCATEQTAREVGGDFYDYFMVDDHTLAVLVADVSDKGVPAALFMMSARQSIRCASQCCHSLEEAISMANRMICDSNESGMFLTLWLGLIDTRSGIGRYCNAGHLYPILRHADGSTEWISNEPDLFLGTFPESTPSTHILRMSAGDTLLLYTDGVTDAMNSGMESYGADRLFGCVAAETGEPAELLRRVTADLREFTGDEEQFDDITLLALCCIRSEAPREKCFRADANAAGTEALLNAVLAMAADCPERIRQTLGIVTDEIISNICEHGYEGRGGKIELCATFGGNFARLRFSDTGAPFDPTTVAEPDINDEPHIGGLGVYFVTQLCDRMEYERKDGNNILTVTTIWNI